MKDHFSFKKWKVIETSETRQYEDSICAVGIYWPKFAQLGDLDDPIRSNKTWGTKFTLLKLKLMQ